MSRAVADRYGVLRSAGEMLAHLPASMRNKAEIKQVCVCALEIGMQGETRPSAGVDRAVRVQAETCACRRRSSCGSRTQGSAKTSRQADKRP